MDEEPELPRLVRNLDSDSHPVNLTRKRVRHGSFTALSSDPALFSSDDDPSADNYLRQRNKKKFRGPWYRQVLASEGNSQETDSNEPAKRSDRKFERKYDSGVFLGSDGTDLDEVLEALENKQTSSLPVRQAYAKPRLQPPKKSAEELWVEGQIQNCLETGNEAIDLSSRGLSTISGTALRSLSTFTTVPPVSQDVFYRLEPDLKVWLSSNNLRTLPEELFQLERLTALSLRGNALRELPPAIGKLNNLRELNISLNRLKYLPYEILDLFSETGSLRSFNIHPNPFLQPSFPQDESLEPAEDQGSSGAKSSLVSIGRNGRGAICYGKPEARRSWNPQWKVAYQARTDVRYFDKYGTLAKGPSFETQADESSLEHHSSLSAVDDGVAPESPAVPDNVISRAPSLVELSLKACLLQNHQQSYMSSLIQEYSPEHLHRTFEQALAQKESGVGKCTVCNREFILKRTEWIEWWEITMAQERGTRGMASAASPLGRMENERDVFERKVPLIRRGCSWLCVPTVVQPASDTEQRGGEKEL